MTIEKFEQYNKRISILDDFFNNTLTSINEVEDNSIKDIIKSIIKDLNLNLKLVSTFGFAITGLYPIIESLLKNMEVSSIEITPTNIVMLTLSVISVILLEEDKRNLSGDQIQELERETKSLLTELKLNGIGNGIVKSMVSCVKSIKNVVNVILKYLGKSVEFLTDMFAYTSLLIPVLNSIGFIINRYSLTTTDLIYNLSSITMGIVTIVAKHGIKELLKRLNIDKETKDNIIHDIIDDHDDEKQKGIES